MIVRTDPRSVAARWAKNCAEDMRFFKSSARMFEARPALEPQAELLGEAIGLAERLQTTLAVIATELNETKELKEETDESDC